MEQRSIALSDMALHEPARRPLDVTRFKILHIFTQPTAFFSTYAAPLLWSTP